MATRRRRPSTLTTMIIITVSLLGGEAVGRFVGSPGGTFVMPSVLFATTTRVTYNTYIFNFVQQSAV